ncbi:MAG: glycosyltransferase family 2 protein, partial [Verrucomicrobiota bacterium]
IEAPRSWPRRRRSGDLLADWLRGFYYPPCSVLWSRQLLTSLMGWNGAITRNDDGDLMFRALLRDTPYAFSRKGTSYYRRVEGSLSAGDGDAAGQHNEMLTLHSLGNRLEESGRLPRYRAPLDMALRDLEWRIDAEAHPELADYNRSLRDRYGLPPARRWWALKKHSLSGRLRQLRPQPTPDAAPSQAITAGQTTARQIEAQRDPAKAAPAQKPRPCPKVSVIIPTYNRKALLARAIESVQAQTFTDFELLVIDDGSTDGTAELMAALDEPRLRYLQQPQNAGVAAARNRGLREARGRYIAFLDSDDTWLPHKLASQVEILDAAPEAVGLVYGGVEDVGADTTRTFLPEAEGRIFEALLLSNVVHAATITSLIRRSAILTAGFFDEQLPAIEDWDYWVRLARFFEFKKQDSVVARYDTSHDGLRKSQEIKNNLTARARFAQKHRRDLREHGLAAAFHLETARRARRDLSGSAGRLWGMRYALRALREEPRAGSTWQFILPERWQPKAAS